MLPQLHWLAPIRYARLYYMTLAVVIALAGVLVIIGRLRGYRQRVGSPGRFDDRTELSRQWLMKGLGALWMIDGFLQAQPAMFTRFTQGFLAPLIIGQPKPVASLIHLGIAAWSVSPVVLDVFTIFIQIGIGLELLWGHLQGQRVALWVSLVWGLVVWIVGEGLGGMLVGGGWFTGTPGSALLYVLGAWALLMPRSWWRSGAGLTWLRWTVAGLFAINALLQALPQAGWWNGGLAGYVRGMAEMPQPEVFSAPLYMVSTWMGHNSALWNGVLVVGLAFFTVAFFIWPKSRALFWLAVAWVFLSWWIGQDFGVLGGMGTDPNTGAVWLLLLFVYADRAQIVDLPHPAGHAAGKTGGVQRLRRKAKSPAGHRP